MKRVATLVFSTFCLCISACKKEKQYSTWTVNSESFSYNDIEVAIDDARSGLVSKDINNRFSLSFAGGYRLPKSGVFQLNELTPGAEPCSIDFYYKGKFYFHTPYKTDTLYASSINDKAIYTMPPCWFVNYDNQIKDSVLISGNFIEP